MWQISKYDTQWDWFWYLVRELEYLLLIFRCCSYCYFLLSLVTHFWSKIDCYFNMSYNILCQQCRPTVGISKVRCEHIIEVWYNRDALYLFSFANVFIFYDFDTFKKENKIQHPNLTNLSASTNIHLCYSPSWPPPLLQFKEYC